MKKHTIEEMQNIAKSMGGKCLSEEYKGTKVNHRWICSNGHVWDTIPSVIIMGCWCPYCRKVAKLNINYCKEIARKRGGKCLSNEYENNHNKLKWECDKGHVWTATLITIQYGGRFRKGCWCPICGMKKSNLKHRLTIKYFQGLAEKNGGKCLSLEHINSKHKVKWQCSKGHIWEAYQQNVSTGSWCPFCSGQKGIHIETMQEIARKKDGKCLSKKYIDNVTKLVWQCKDGHIWKATPGNVKAGCWCPDCASIEHVCERISRRYFEIIFNEKFPKSRPHWLKNDKGHRMELDGYNQEKAIAFEYNGLQHYDEATYFSTKNLLENDKSKKKICKEKGIKLIIIPCWIKIEQIRNFIIDACRTERILPNNLPINIYDFNLMGINNSRLNEMKSISLLRGGNCLSNTYINAKTKLLFKCKEGHIWKATPDSVKRGSWCPHHKRESYKNAYTESNDTK